MNSFEGMAHELERQGKGDALKRLADSEDGKRIGRMVDAEKLEKAAKDGDSRALREMLAGVLQTDEGKRLAESLRRLLQ